MTFAAAPPAPPAPLAPALAASIAANDLARVAKEDRYFTRYYWEPYPDLTWQRTWQLHENLLSRYSEMVGVVIVHPQLWRIDIRHPIWDGVTYDKARFNDPYFHRQVPVEEFLANAKSEKSYADVEFYTPVKFVGFDGRGFPVYTGGGKKRVVRFVEGEEVPTHANQDPADSLFLRKETSCEAPILWARWLFVQQCQQRNLLNQDDAGLGYYDFLGVKKRADFLKLVDTDVRDPDKVQPFSREFRAAKDKSDISEQNRIIVRFRARGEAGLWVTLDTKTQYRRGVALKKLGPGEFLHDTEEWIGPGNNGLPKYLLSDNKGNLQNVAPGDTHGLHYNHPSNEARNQALPVNRACIGCHKGDVIIPFRDDVRGQYYAGGYLAAGVVAVPPPNPKVSPFSRKKKAAYKPYLQRHDKAQAYLEFKRLYLSDVYFWMRHDITLYRRAVEIATKLDPTDEGLKADEATAAYARAFHHYATDAVTIRRAARELGVPVHVWQAALQWYSRPKMKEGVEINLLADTALARFLQKDPLTLTRLTWEDSYALASDILMEFARSLAPFRGAEKTWHLDTARYFASVPAPSAASPSSRRREEAVIVMADTATTPIRPTRTRPTPTPSTTRRSSSASVSSPSASTAASTSGLPALPLTSSSSLRASQAGQRSASQREEREESLTPILPASPSSPRGSPPASAPSAPRCPACALISTSFGPAWTATKSACELWRLAWAPFRQAQPALPLPPDPLLRRRLLALALGLLALYQLLRAEMRRSATTRQVQRSEER